MSSWPMQAIRHLGQVTLGKMLQTEPRNQADVELPYLRAAHIQPDGTIIDASLKTMWFSARDRIVLDLQVGDVVVVEGGAGYGRSAYIHESMPGWGFQNSIVRIRPHSHASSGRFLDYALQSALSEGRIQLECNTATFSHFTAEKVSAFRVPTPSLSMQRAIADYLDDETSKIDALIGKQRILVERLKERRESVIAASTTRGTEVADRHEPDDIGWLTKVPDRWSIKRLSRLAKLKTGATPEGGGASLDSVFEGIPWITPEGLGDGCVPTKIIDGATISASAVMNSTVVLVCTIGATLGRVGISVGPVTSNQQITMVDFAGDARFFYYQLLAARKIIRSLASGNTLPILNNAALKQLRLAVPPLEEQEEIVEYLDRETARIDTLIAKSQRLITLSRERRSALITAAVTGQIDVAEMEPGEEAA